MKIENIPWKIFLTDTIYHYSCIAFNYTAITVECIHRQAVTRNNAQTHKDACTLFSCIYANVYLHMHQRTNTHGRTLAVFTYVCISVCSQHTNKHGRAKVFMYVTANVHMFHLHTDKQKRTHGRTKAVFMYVREGKGCTCTQISSKAVFM